ncbi:MAG: CvpA family protein [Pseudomonadales bacterium]|nr:CvpA family protein [Pseudomonadales bacterium]
METVILFAVVVLYFAYRGFKVGWVHVAAVLLAVLSGYIVTFLGLERALQWLTENTLFKGVIAYPIAGFTLFTLSSAITYGLVRLFLRLGGIRNRPRSVGGAMLNGVVGVVLGLVVVWLYTLIKPVVLQKTTASEIAATPNVVQSGLESLANRLMAVPADWFAQSTWENEPDKAQLASYVFSNPVQASQQAGYLINNPELKALFSQPESQALLSAGDTDALMVRPELTELVNQPEFSELAKTFPGLEEKSNNPEALKQAVAKELVGAQQRFDRVKSNPEFQEIIADPEVQALLQQQSWPQLLNSAKVRKLIDVLFKDNTDSTSATGTELDDRSTEPDAQARKKMTVYRWRDKAGQTQVSDTPPSGGVSFETIER